MRLVFGLVLIAGLGLAGFAVYMAQNYIGAYESALIEERAKTQASVPTHQIYVTTRTIAYGEVIKPEDVQLAPWPQEIIPEGYFDEKNPMSGTEEGPRVAVRQMEKFEAVVAVKVSDPGGTAGLTSQLSKGERAFAIKVDVTSGVSGFLRPGDRVDIYWTGRMPGSDRGGPQGDVTKLIETGVRLIAIDQVSDSDSAGTSIARTVTVAAIPQQVAQLAQAQKTGQLSLSLLATYDDTVSEAIEVDQISLLGLERIEPEEMKRQEQTCTRIVRRGVERTEIPVPCTN